MWETQLLQWRGADARKNEVFSYSSTVCTVLSNPSMQAIQLCHQNYMAYMLKERNGWGEGLVFMANASVVGDGTAFVYQILTSQRQRERRAGINEVSK